MDGEDNSGEVITINTLLTRKVSTSLTFLVDTVSFYEGIVPI